VESIAQLDNPNTLTLLIEQNRTVVAPALFWPENRSTNFMGFYDIENVFDFIVEYGKITTKKRRFGFTLLNNQRFYENNFHEFIEGFGVLPLCRLAS
jgi:hypothetical protein